MLGGYLVAPSSVDVWSTLVMGIAAAVVGPLIVAGVRNKAERKRAVWGSVLALAILLLAWLSWYNLPAYYYIVRGGNESHDKGCTYGVDAWRKANQKQPSLGIPYLQIGVCYCNEGNYEVGVQWLEAGETYEPRGEILTSLGGCYLGWGQHDLAKEHYEEALALKPDSFDAKFGLGLTLHYQLKYTESLAVLEQAVAMDPDKPAARFWRGWALFENQRYQEALADFQFAVDSGFRTARAHAGLGFCHMKMANYGLARQEFEAALASDPSQQDVQTALSSIEGK